MGSLMSDPLKEVCIMKNSTIEELSEIYGRIKLYCVIQSIKDQLNDSTITQEYRKELEEALEYAQKRKLTIPYEGC
jgi:hypothetical protein